MILVRLHGLDQEELLRRDHQHFGHTHTWYGSFTPTACIPVLETIYEGDTLDEDALLERTETLHSIRFSDMSLGIKDPKVFEPPSYCKDLGNATLSSVIQKNLHWHRFAYL